MAHNTAVVPHAWTIISNSWKLDLSFDCFKTTITSESKAFSSKRSNGPWKQNSCEFCLRIKVGSCYKITPHSSRLVIYKMQNLVAFLLPQKKHFLLFSGRVQGCLHRAGTEAWCVRKSLLVGMTGNLGNEAKQSKETEGHSSAAEGRWTNPNYQQLLKGRSPWSYGHTLQRIRAAPPGTTSTAPHQCSMPVLFLRLRNSQQFSFHGTMVG